MLDPGEVCIVPRRDAILPAHVVVLAELVGVLGFCSAPFMRQTLAETSGNWKL